MVNIGLTKVDDKVAARHPGLQGYAVCQSHAFVRGSGTFAFGAYALYTFQMIFQKKYNKPYPLKWNLLFSIVTSSVITYAVVRWDTQQCVDEWILQETGKLPDRSPPQVSEPEVKEGPRKTKYGDAMD